MAEFPLIEASANICEMLKHIIYQKAPIILTGRGKALMGVMPLKVWCLLDAVGRVKEDHDDDSMWGIVP